MNTVEEVKNILSDQVPVEDNLVISTNIQRNKTNASDTTLFILMSVKEFQNQQSHHWQHQSLFLLSTNGASKESSKLSLTSSDFECSLENSNASETSAYTNIFGRTRSEGL